MNDLTGGNYYEPFAGGAGAALSLLKNGIVSSVHLNDLDPCIFAFWHSVLTDPHRFAHRVRTIPLTIDEWRRQKALYHDSDHRQSRSFDLGFATFYLNRCNRSGIISGSAPIGGFAQDTHWQLDARYNPDRLAERIIAIAVHKDRIHISNKDALAFLREHVRVHCPHSFVYLDPPYISAGNRLYFNTYQEHDHRSLATYLTTRSDLKWLLSYDNDHLIKALYRNMVIDNHFLRYSLQNRRPATELLIAPHHVALPKDRR